MELLGVAQARRQDLAAGGQKPEGGHIFKTLYWMYAATRGSNVKWGAGHHWPPAGDDPGVAALCVEVSARKRKRESCSQSFKLRSFTSTISIIMT